MEAEDKAIAYIEMATGRPINDFDPADFLATYARLLDLNAPVSIPAILRAHGKGNVPLAFRYPGRWMASLVESLVGAGFTPQYVLEECDPDEAWLYFQEAQYTDWGNYQRAYSLSEMGRGKNGKQKAMPPPAWVGTAAAPQKRRDIPKVPARLVPTGNVINLRDPDVLRKMRA